MKIQKTLNRILVCLLLTGMFSGMALAVEANTLPFVPFEPTHPTEPEVPDRPNTPTEPETPDRPNTPTEPETPEVPDSPTEPDRPNTPETPNNPGNSGVPDWSDIFEWLDKQESNTKRDPPKEEPEREEPEQTDYSNCKRDKNCPMHTFTDLDKTAWYHDGIHYCIENGFMNGTAVHTFAPDTALSRAMIVTVLWRLEGEPVVNYVMPFPDIPGGEWYTEAVRWAAAEGLVNGYEDNTFRPGASVTREQVMAILHRYAVYKELDSGVHSPMTLRHHCSQWAEKDVLWADKAGLTDIGTEIFDMTVSAARAEIAAYLMEFCLGFGMEY